jgi:hypothetical protein
MKTVGLMDTLPDRIEKIETDLKNLELEYTDHKATTITDFKAFKDSLRLELDNIKAEVELLDKVAKTLQGAGMAVDGRIEVLENDLDQRNTQIIERTAEIKTYRMEAGKKIIGTLSLIILIFIAVSIGVPSEYLEDDSINESDLKSIISRYPKYFSYNMNTNKSNYYFIAKEYIQLINNNRFSGRQIRINRGR